MANLLDRASVVLTPTAYNNGEALCIKPDDASGDFTFSRNSAATRVNAQGLVENVQILSSNLVQNPSFSEEGVQEVSNGSFSNGSTDWNLGTGWSIGTDKATFDETIGGAGNLSQSNILTVGKTYKLTFDTLETNGGNIAYSLGSSYIFINAIQANTTYTVYGVSEGTQFTLRGAGNFNGSITNISAKEVGQNWDLGTGFSIGEDKAFATNASNSNLQQTNITISNTKKYKINFTINDYTSGSVRPMLGAVGAVVGTFVSANGTYTEILTANNNFDRIVFRTSGTAFNGSITNISVIEITNDTNLPRINYEGFSYDGSGNVVPDSGCGSWLFEPQSTNLITYSEDFSQWATVGTPTITSNYGISPDGTQNSTRIQFDANERIYFILSASGNITFSVYLKGSGVLTLRDNTNGYRQDVTLTSEWARYDLSFNATITSIQIQNQTASIVDCEIWGAMLEENSYPTSLIPTDGSTVTRNEDLCNNGGSLATINSTEGVFYAEIRKDVIAPTFQLISLNNAASNSDANSVTIGFEGGTDFYVRVKSPSGSFTSQTIFASNNEFHKIAIRYEQANIGLFIDGIKEATYTGNYLFTQPLDNLSFDYNGNGTLPFYGKTKALAVWKEALSDQELAELTTI